MVVDKFGTHVTKRIHKHIKKKISTYFENKILTDGVLHIKRVRLTETPTNGQDAVTLRYISNIINDLERTIKVKFEDIIEQKFFIFDDKIDNKISKLRSLFSINLILKLHGDVYKLQNGNSEYIFPCNATIKKIRYNIEKLLIETKINNKSLSLEEQIVSVNDKLTFLPIEGQLRPDEVSVELLLHTNLI